MKTPPERIVVKHPDGIEVRRIQQSDAEAIALAVRESQSHLSRFMPWARQEDSLSPEFQRERLKQVDAEWDQREQFQYMLCRTSDPAKLLGCIGLMTRMGPGTIEFGYWVHADHEGKGYIRAGCAALADIAIEMDGVETLYICCDPENHRSMKIPLSLGFAAKGMIDNHPVSGVKRVFTKRKMPR